jgi:hypothetical protein
MLAPKVRPGRSRTQLLGVTQKQSAAASLRLTEAFATLPADGLLKLGNWGNQFEVPYRETPGMGMQSLSSRVRERVISLLEGVKLLSSPHERVCGGYLFQPVRRERRADRYFCRVTDNQRKQPLWAKCKEDEDVYNRALAEEEDEELFSQGSLVSLAAVPRSMSMAERLSATLLSF